MIFDLVLGAPPPKSDLDFRLQSEIGQGLLDHLSQMVCGRKVGL
jgi:hypothetical protein